MAVDDSSGLADMGLLIRGMQVTRMLEVVATLGVADRIGEAPQPVAELAAAVGADPAMLARLCRALAACGVFEVDAEGRVSHNERSRWLRTDARPTLYHAVRYWGMPSTWDVWSRLEEVVRSGEPAFEAMFGKPYFAYLKDHPDEAARFDSFMQNSPDDRHAAVAEAYDFSGAGVVVDIGGGNGALLAAILKAYPSVRGVLFDHPEVIAPALSTFPVLSGRCSLEGGDFFETVPGGGDVYTLSQIIHDWSDERCLAILGKCRRAMHQGARLLVIERVLDPIPDSAKAANYLADMHMMVLFGEARERTAEEFAALFAKAGFEPPRIRPTRSSFFVIETRPALASAADSD